MLNTAKLAGRTVFVTGASRGIGKEIALKAARDGANVVIAAKTAEPHPKLPGTIYTAAKEIEEAGGKCLPCVVDIRDEAQLQAAVDETVKTFGGIDIVVNNASAISLTGTLETSMKKYDLMHSINTRGTYLTSKLCLPYLKVGKNPHILNISPPLSMKPHWFSGHVAYTMAKYGMSMCVLGMAEELKADGIAVNALWPRTMIWTAAAEMLSGYAEESRNQSRKPEIMADAAYVILTRDSKSFTGNFCVDDTILKEVGVTDFNTYAYKDGAELMPDFFLDDEDPTMIREMAKKAGAGQPGHGSAKASTSSGGAIAGIFSKIQGLVASNPDLSKGVGAVFQFELTGGEPGTWHMDLKSPGGSSGQGAPSATADVFMTLTSDDFTKMFTGKMKPAAAFMAGKLKIKGDIMMATKLEKLMKEIPTGDAAPQDTGAGGSAGGAVKIFDQIKSMMNDSLVESMGAVFQFELKGNETGTWHLDLKSPPGNVGQGSPSSGDPDVTMIMDSDDFVKMFQGSLKPTAAFMAGKLKIKGDMGKAMKLEKLMGAVKSKL
ncbi:hydroxysteroid dehydrogenase-like protein 2 isoform X2 [Amphiura filiformis]|uniref:hydroxysteroid dehydrogenase-like protein 2 isoform X2 n=1 Tax=Amphiura filiformis TaxID=82378 RepID=UPI003B21B50E